MVLNICPVVKSQTEGGWLRSVPSSKSQIRQKYKPTTQTKTITCLSPPRKTKPLQKYRRPGGHINSHHWLTEGNLPRVPEVPTDFLERLPRWQSVINLASLLITHFLLWRQELLSLPETQATANRTIFQPVQKHKDTENTGYPLTSKNNYTQVRGGRKTQDEPPNVRPAESQASRILAQDLGHPNSQNGVKD